MTITEIKDLASYCERINIAYKETSSGLPKSFWETQSVFANTIGGCYSIMLKTWKNQEKKSWTTYIIHKKYSANSQSAIQTHQTPKAERLFNTPENVSKPNESVVEFCLTQKR